MAKQGEDWGGCFAMAVGVAVFAWFITAPSSDQVCRDHKVPIFDSLHGIDYQPSCQALLDRLDAQLEDERRKASDLDDRVSELESKLSS